MDNKYDTLKARNAEIATLVDVNYQSGNMDEIGNLKRELYSNKLLMLDIVEASDKRNSYTAQEIKNRVNSLKPAIRYETGFKELDEKLKGGFEVGSFIILGGQSGAGKTETLLNLLSKVSEYNKCVFFNFEMGDRRIIKRLNRSLKTENQWTNFIINSDSRDIDDLLMEITLHAHDGVMFFAIDSRMKINVNGGDSEYQKISNISKRLSEVAVKHDIIILLVNQISEENLKTGRLAFKGSGDQQYDADMTLFIVIEENDYRKFICTKNRQDEYLFEASLPKPSYLYAMTETAVEYIPSDEDLKRVGA